MASIRKGVTTKAGAPRWQVRWRQDGKSVSETFPTELGAIKFRGLVDAAGQRYPDDWTPGRGFVPVAPRPTLAQWFERVIGSRPGANPRTRSDYQSNFANCVPPWLADKPLERITREDVGKWLVELEGRTLSPKTIHNVHNMVSSVMKDAQADGLLTRNPFAGRSKPLPRHEEMVFLTPTEFATFLPFVSERYRPLVTFLYGTGLRWGEATALHRENVDLGRMCLHVSGAWKRAVSKSKGGEGGYYYGTPKSVTSRRTVTLTPKLTDLLVSATYNKAPGDLVFTDHAGDRIAGGTFYSQVWSPARKNAEAAGFGKHPRVHDLRHSHAALLLSGGQPVLAVSRRLGHASISITGDIYGHLLPEVDVALLGLLGEAGL